MKSAMNQEDSDCWKEAYENEIYSLENVGDMKVIQRREDMEVIPIMELFERKFDNIDGKGRYKVRIVARGDKQKDRPDESKDIFSSDKN